MSWTIWEVTNTLKIPAKIRNNPEFQKEFMEAWHEHHYEDDNIDYIISEDGILYFNPDDMEHMDYLWQEEIQKVLKKWLRLKKPAEIGFISENEPTEPYGYRFMPDGTIVQLIGKIVWKEV